MSAAPDEIDYSPREYGFSPLRCVVWSGVLFGGLTVGGMLIRWGLELMS